MTRNDANAKGNEMLTKLQAFADTLDLNEARVEIGTHDFDRDVVWLKWRAIGCDRVRSMACGLTKHGIRYIKKQMKEVEASLV
jgi:hypothetical protein